MYKLNNLVKDYRKGRDTVHALRGVNLEIADGEWLSIQGPTGHGKSTLLQLLGGLDRPTSGSLDLAGHDLSKLGEGSITKVRAELIGFIFQTFNLIPTLSAQENVETALVPLGVKDASRKSRAAEALASVGLADRARHLPSELSGGQQQRVAIARALVKEPKVLLADEPTGNLDEDTRDEIMGLLDKLWQEKGLTMVMVTHDSSVARRAQRLGIMRNGQLTVKQGRAASATATGTAAGRTETPVAANTATTAKAGDKAAAAKAAAARAAAAKAAAEAAAAEAAAAEAAAAAAAAEEEIADRLVADK
jgi:putative ABC transport system ATP-binding protein